MISDLEKKLDQVELSDGPSFAFVPKVHVHGDVSKWFCSIFRAMSTQDSARVRSLSDAMRKAIWDVVQEVEPVPDLKDQDFGSDQADALVKEMVRIMKFRVVSYERTTRQVVEYTRTMIGRARKMAQALMRKQDDLSRHIRSKAMTIKQEKIGQLPERIESTIVIDDPAFGQAFQVSAQGSSKQQVLDQMKQKASKVYRRLGELQQARVHAILQHDKAKVKHIDTQIKKLRTHTRAIMGARQHMASMIEQTMDDDGKVDQTVESALARLEAGMSSQKMVDYDLYKQEIEHQIDEHTNGMALFLGLQTQQEIMQLRRDLIQEVCKHVAELFDKGRQEVLLLNQEMTTFYRDLAMNKEALHYLELVAKRYRASIAKIQVMLLALFDKRS